MRSLPSSRFLGKGAVDGTARRRHGRDLVGVDQHDILEARIASAALLAQARLEQVALAVDLDEAGGDGGGDEVGEKRARPVVDAAIEIGVEQASVQVERRLDLSVFESEIEQAVKTVAADAGLAAAVQQGDETRGEVVQVESEATVHLLHAQVAQVLDTALHAHVHHALDPAAGGVPQREQLLQALDALEDAAEKQAVEDVPGDVGMDGLAEADVHVGPAQHQIALDEKLVPGPRFELAGEELGRLAQDVVAGVDGEEGDVGRNDQGRQAGRGDEGGPVLQAQSGDPAVEVARRRPPRRPTGCAS